MQPQGLSNPIFSTHFKPPTSLISSSPIVANYITLGIVDISGVDGFSIGLNFRGERV